MAPPVGWERVARAAGQFEARLRRAIIDWAESVQRSMTVDQIVEEIRSGRVEEVFAAAITAAETAAMFAAFTEMTRAAARMSAGIVFDEYGPSLPGRYGPAGGAYPTSGTAGPFTISFARIDQAASDWAAVQWREVWAGITDEAQRSIRAILVRAPIEGISVYEQARLFRSLIGLDARQWQGALNRQAALIARLQGGMSAAAYRRAAAQYDRWVARQLRIRAMRIARTESLRAARWSQLEAFRAARDAGLISGAARWEWGAQPDACDICRELDGTTYSIDEWGPDTHPNCRCWQTSYFPGDEVYEQHRPTFTGKSAVAKPLGRYADFDACVSAMSSKLGSVGAARRYCGRLRQRIEGGGPDG